MNQTFSLKRIGRLLRKQLTDYQIHYLLGMGVLLGGLVLLMGGTVYLERQHFSARVQASFFSVLLLAAGAYFTSTVFAAVGDKQQAASLLLLPASRLEKYLVGWGLSLLAFTAVYTATFYVADILTIQFVRLQGYPASLFNVFSAAEPSSAWLLKCYPLLHGFMLYGSVFFRKNQFVRTAALGLLGLLILAIVNWQVLHVLLGASISLALPFGSATVHGAPAAFDMMREVSVPAHQLPWLGALPVVLAVMLWVAAYFRFAETQV